MMEATAADEDDEDGTGKVVNVAQLYQTLMLLSGGANGSVASTVARIVQAHGVSPLVQLVRQSAALFLAADAETQALFTSATAGEGDASALAALLERYNPLLEQANAPGASVFDADEDAGLGAAQHADGAISSAAGADEDAGNDAFHDAEDDGQAFRMHELVYAGDVDGLRAYILQFGGSEIHMLDARGNTPAHVAVLRHSLPALQLLLQAGYDVSVQSSAGWTVLEDAVAVGDVPIVRELLVASHEAQLRMWRQKKPVVLHAMESMPDFQMKLSWEFGSPVFSGLVKQFAPYDEYTIYKVGTKLRVDASIVGFEGVRWVRGRVSLRFDGGAPEGELCIVNHDERKVFAKEAGMFAGKQEADSLEAEADFLLGTEVVQVNVRTANTTFDPVKLRLRDGHKTEAVGGWSTTVYAASSDLEIERKTKTGKVRALPETFGEYLNPPETHDTAAARRGRRGGRRRASNDEEEVQVIKKRATGRANMVRDFPISTEQLVHLLEMVAPLNKEIAKARSFLQEKVPEGLFPVKMKIPVAMSVHLQIAFPHFELVSEDDPTWWLIPPDYEKRSMVEQLQALGDKIEKLVVEDEEQQAATRRADGGGAAAPGRRALPAPAPGEMKGAASERAPVDGITRP
ncbi:hypothetical protein KFE25_010138 [Diacronema lutheri]|uniref:Ankyrin repeat domain-containing protein n=2 Tax=Diacronema lutheri TaxID=2081491 RepID=A0A8J5XSS4_DIALT|nr:hypothetical protein KFE25_010138 [Diacronema lutheri]